jgi:hypothetical protein
VGSAAQPPALELQNCIGESFGIVPSFYNVKISAVIRSQTLDTYYHGVKKNWGVTEPIAEVRDGETLACNATYNNQLLCLVVLEETQQIGTHVDIWKKEGSPVGIK